MFSDANRLLMSDRYSACVAMLVVVSLSLSISLCGVCAGPPCLQGDDFVGGG